MRNTIPPSDLEAPAHKRQVIRNRQMGSFAYRRTNFWNNNRSCYSVWVSHHLHIEQETNIKTLRWDYRPPVHGNVLPASFVVFSYGPHFPLFVYDNKSGLWFENQDKYSATTTQHRTYAHPKDEYGAYVKTHKCSTERMMGVAKLGMVYAVRNILTNRI